MKKVLLLIAVVVCIHAFAYVPITADYVLFLKDFETLNSFLPPNNKLSDHTDGFVCFFGKMTLDLSGLVGLIETEEFSNAQNLLDVSIVTNDPDWFKKNFSEFLVNREVIQVNDLYYFASAMMVEDVKAMINDQIPKIKLNEDAAIYVKMQTIPIVGIVLHLFGFNEGVPVEDEISVSFDSDTARIFIKSNKSHRTEWEVKRAQSQVLPKGLKTLKDAQFSLVVPTSILNQIPTEVMEEVGIDLEKFEFIFTKSTGISLSFSEDTSKFALFFDFKEESLEDLIDYFDTLGAFARRTEDFIYLSSDEFVAVLPTKGGIAEVLSKNVDEKDLIPVEGGVLGRIVFKQDSIFADLSLHREDCSVVSEARLSKDLISTVLSEILSEFLPKPEELNLLNDIIDSIDFRCYYMYSDPPEDIDELEQDIYEELSDRVVYERKEEDGRWLVKIGVKTDLVDTMTEDDVMNSLSVEVNDVQIDKENRFIYVTKTYDKYQLPSAEDLITDFVEAIRQYYEDNEVAPEDLSELLFWYVDYPEEVLDILEYEQEPSGKTITVKLSITTDEEINESLIEELNLKDLFHKDGVLTVVFELP
ncbi:hypothetical protein [Thermotoga profunda]|uniref:hypothetical protein n=1 Tax=Thermotoga profunda TaxID=1508420 RepID=UPI000597841C|nr:hypothetical protein [Thermotoga profunda]